MRDDSNEIWASWATDDVEGRIDHRGWPSSGVVLFGSVGRTPAIAARSSDLARALGENGFLAVGVGSVLVAGDSQEWGRLMARLASPGVEPGLLEAPLTRRSSHVFSATISPSSVIVRGPAPA